MPSTVGCAALGLITTMVRCHDLPSQDPHVLPTIWAQLFGSGSGSDSGGGADGANAHAGTRVLLYVYPVLFVMTSILSNLSLQARGRAGARKTRAAAAVRIVVVVGGVGGGVVVVTRVHCRRRTIEHVVAIRRHGRSTSLRDLPTTTGGKLVGAFVVATRVSRLGDSRDEPGGRARRDPPRCRASRFAIPPPP